MVSAAELDELITLVSKVIENYTGCDLATHSETQLIDGDVEFLISQCTPIQTITSITDMTDSAVVSASTYDFYPEEGLIYRNQNTVENEFLSLTWGTGKRRWQVVYTSGYSPIPEDIQLAINMEVASILNRKDQNLIIEKLGDYEYTAESGMSKRVKQLLAHYRRHGI